MEAIVLCGGLGTRLRSVVQDVPKPMAPVKGIPFVEIIVNTLRQQGVCRVILSVGYKSHSIIDYFGGDYKGMKIHYVVEQNPLGTGGGIRMALDKVDEEWAVVLNGDTFVEVDLTLLEKKWQQSSRNIIVGCHVEDTERYGRIDIKENSVQNFLEKGQTGPGIINSGVYVIKKDSLCGFEVGKKFSFEKDYLLEAVKSGQFDVYETKGLFIDIGIPEDYYKAEKYLDHIIKEV